MQHNPKAYIRDIVGLYSKEVTIFTPLDVNRVDVNLGKETKTVDIAGTYESNLATFIASDDELQALYEELKRYFRVGHDETYVDGKLQATEKHLDDMRRLIFEDEKTVNIERPMVYHTESDRPLNKERD